MPGPGSAPPKIDFLSGEFYVDGAREAYQWLRDEAPVYFDATSQLWGIARYDDVLAVERDAETYSNAGGSRPDTGPLPWMIDMDGAGHRKRRKLVNRGFTPARVRAVEPHLREICDGLIDRVCEQGACDVVRDLAAPLPMIVIGDMLGVAPADRDDLLAWSHGMLGSLSGEPEAFEAAAEAFGAYVEYANGMIADRRVTPTDDLFSVLVHAEVDGERLEDDEIVFESLLLLIGGDETTRQVTAAGLEQLLLHPEHKVRLLADPGLVPSAVEEMLRWVSPIKNMARTTTRQVELAGVTLEAGTKVIVLYESADFDERHFVKPHRFDIERDPNDHLAFGFGPHVCLGASLARAELRAMFDRLLSRLPDMELATAQAPGRSIAGIDELPVVFSTSAPPQSSDRGPSGPTSHHGDVWDETGEISQVVLEVGIEEIDQATAAQFEAEVVACLSPPPGHFVVDLARVSFLDSSGIRVLVGANGTVTGAGGTMVVRNASSVVRRALEVVGLEHLLEAE